MSFSLGSVIDILPQEHLTMLRPSIGALIKGFRQKMTGEETATPFKGHVQPTTPSVLAKIEGGENIEEAISIYTKFALRGADDRDGLEADRIERKRFPGRRYKIISVEDWDGQGFRVFIAGTVKA